MFGDLSDPPSLHWYTYGKVNPTVWVDPDGRIAELRALQERIRAKKAAIIAGAGSISDAVFGEDTVLGNLAGRVEAKLKGRAAGALGLADRGVGFLNFSANVGAATALGSDHPIAQEAALELEAQIDSTIEGVKAGVSYVVENPGEAASAVVDAVATGAAKLAAGDPQTIAKVEAFKTEIVAEVLLTKGAGSVSSATRRTLDGAADAVQSLNRTRQVRNAVRAADDAPPAAPPALKTTGSAPGARPAARGSDPAAPRPSQGPAKNRSGELDAAAHARRTEPHAGQAQVAAPTPTINEVLTGARQVRGRFPRTADPGEVLVRRDATGRPTHYQIYDGQGFPVRRVDITGKPHGGVETPHVLEFERHVRPDSGEVFVKPAKTVRPATADEIPG